MIRCSASSNRRGGLDKIARRFNAEPSRRIPPPPPVQARSHSTSYRPTGSSLRPLRMNLQKQHMEAGCGRNRQLRLPHLAFVSGSACPASQN